jgi:hypothetical protein
VINYFEAILIMFGLGLVSGVCGGIVTGHIFKKTVLEDIRAEKAGDLGE